MVDISGVLSDCSRDGFGSSGISEMAMTLDVNDISLELNEETGLVVLFGEVDENGVLGGGGGRLGCFDA